MIILWTVILLKGGWTPVLAGELPPTTFYRVMWAGLTVVKVLQQPTHRLPEQQERAAVKHPQSPRPSCLCRVWKVPVWKSSDFSCFTETFQPLTTFETERSQRCPPTLCEAQAQRLNWTNGLTQGAIILSFHYRFLFSFSHKTPAVLVRSSASSPH